MREDRTLLVGLDLCDDFSQLSCFNAITYEPKSIGKNGDETNFFIPTILSVRPETNEWSFGEDAISLVEQGKGMLISNILERSREQEDVFVAGKFISSSTILEKYLKKMLSLLKIEYPNQTIQSLVVTIASMDMNLIKDIYLALENLGIHKDRATIQSHEQSYIYYALSQKKELWMNDVALFDFTEKGLSYYQLSINRKMSPIVVGVNKKDFEDILSYNMIKESQDNENIAYIFENIARSVLHKQIISTIYFTGQAFEGEWFKESLQGLCMGRRVFIGQNLYTKGACYAAREAIGEGKLKDFLFLGDDMITADIYMSIYHDAKLEEMALAKSGTSWYNVEETVEIIADDEEEIEIVVHDIMKRTTIRHLITLDGMRKKPNRTVRLELRLKFLDIKSCVVTVRDMGFGEFYPSSNRIWEKTFVV